MTLMSNDRFSDSRVLDQLREDYCQQPGYSERDFQYLLQWLSLPPQYTTIRCNDSSRLEILKNELLIQINKQTNYTPFIIETHPIISNIFIIHPIENQIVKPVDGGKEIIVDSRCGVSVQRGAPVFAPGIIGASKHLKVGDKVSVYADVLGKCLKGSKAFESEGKTFLGNGIALMSRQDLFNQPNPSGIALDMYEKMSNCPSLRDLMGSQMFLQNLPSVLCGIILDPKSEDYVLDMCAAPGGKTTHIASLMKDKGVIIALDKTNNKVEKLKSTVENQGFQSVKCFVCDSAKSVDKTKNYKNDSTPLAPPFSPNVFDKVLLDAPCSALGQRPQMYNKMTLKELHSYPKIQKKLFSAAVELVKPGGVLVYSTCTLTIAENEGIVKWALKKFPYLKLEQQTPHLGGFALKGSELSEEDSKKIQRFDAFSPGCDYDRDTIGFFIAKFVKN